MKEMIFTTMPMFVCLFWSTMLALDMPTQRHKRARWHLLAFMLATTILYWGHCAFFNHAIDILPLADTLYARIQKLYRLMPTNYLAYDMLTGGSRYRQHYSADVKNAFLQRMNHLDSERQKVMLEMYANPVVTSKA